MSAWSIGWLEGTASFHTSSLFSSKTSGAPSLAWLMLLLGLKLKRTFLNLQTASQASGNVVTVINADVFQFTKCGFYIQ